MRRLSFYHLTLLLVLLTTLDYRLFADRPGVPSVTLAELLSYAILGLYAVRLVVSSPPDSADIVRCYRANRSFFLYFFWAAVAAIASVLLRSSYTALAMFKDMVPGLILYMCVALFGSSELRIRRLLQFYCLGIVVNIAVAISQALQGFPRIVPLSDSAQAKMTVSGEAAANVSTGFLSHPNALAMMLIPFILIMTVRLLHKKRRFTPRQVAEFALWSLALYALYHTYAKGAWAWVAIATGLAMISVRARRRLFASAIATIAFGISGLITYGTYLAGRDVKTLGTLLDRLVLWSTAIDTIVGSTYVQLLGDGFSSLQTLSYQLGTFEYANAHNIVLNQVIFYGIPAAAFYLGALFKGLRSIALTIPRLAGDRKVVPVAIMVSLVALFGEYFFEPANEGVVLQSHFFLFLSLATSSVFLQYATGPRDGRETATVDTCRVSAG